MSDAFKYIFVMGCLNTNNFIFLFFYFSDFILIFFSFLFLLDDEVACDIISLEHGGKI